MSKAKAVIAAFKRRGVVVDVSQADDAKLDALLKNFSRRGDVAWGWARGLGRGGSVKVSKKGQGASEMLVIVVEPTLPDMDI